MADKKTVKKIIIGLVSVAILGAVAYGANLGNRQTVSDATAKDKGLIPLKTWTRKDCGSTPFAVGVTQGFFKEEGLEIVFTGDTQPAQQIPSVLNGNNDIGGGFHPNQMAVAIAGGAKIKGVVTGGIDPLPDQDPKLRHMNWYVNPKNNPDIHSFADLNKLPGQLKFSTITTNICADFLANNIADNQGVARDKIEWVTMPDIQAVQALKQGLVAVAGVHPPFYKSMEEAGMVKIADSLDAKITVAGGITYYVFNEDFIAKNPETVKKFSRAIVKAQKWANEHPEEARKITEDWIGVPVNATHYFAAGTEIDESLIVPWIKDLENSNVIPKGKVKPSDLVISSAVNAGKTL
ncbi:MAG TPA: ABC transporter substrate-binding protein [Methylomusa anaerophila]|uniref:NMT1/THI5 like protein n=1 Tax=Methylomusa anaerophila TaxID=1930071 RepID=A0A348AEL2_9FIRM|nr:ABC transporter substrate-binding protein [Methylomusa anaerophila]BBB89510.1 NMT1/THI5 like protein [Methylomusa anaerophila]HML90120.1 ABC transporter substrate-binding protein [Methylomusa anaerophila]